MGLLIQKCLLVMMRLGKVICRQSRKFLPLDQTKSGQFLLNRIVQWVLLVRHFLCEAAELQDCIIIKGTLRTISLELYTVLKEHGLCTSLSGSYWNFGFRKLENWSDECMNALVTETYLRTVRWTWAVFIS